MVLCCPKGVLEDDGADRGIMFAFVGANIGRQFEFVQSSGSTTESLLGPARTKIQLSDRMAMAEILRFLVSR